jgi:DNA-binding transcriptional regulator YdaS (Cro superfamily)
MEKINKTPPKVLKKLLAHFRSQRGLARALNIKQPSVFRWFAEGKVPVTRALQIEKVSGGLFTAKEIRPDIFG